MQEATITELRNQAERYFDLIEAGETVRVFRRGRPIADIQPIHAGIPSWKRRVARPLALDGVAISKLILEDRRP